MEDIEEWRDLVGAEAIYQVSSHGRVRSKERIVGGKGGCKRAFPGKVIEPNINHNGYLQAGIRKNKKFQSYKIHRLVAEAFLDKIPGKDFVNHKDMVKTNNQVSNLEWVDRSENIMHARKYFTGSAPKERRKNWKTLKLKPIIPQQGYFINLGNKWMVYDFGKWRDMTLEEINEVNEAA